MLSVQLKNTAARRVWNYTGLHEPRDHPAGENRECRNSSLYGSGLILLDGCHYWLTVRQASIEITLIIMNVEHNSSVCTTRQVLLCVGRPCFYNANPLLVKCQNTFLGLRTMLYELCDAPTNMPNINVFI